MSLPNFNEIDEIGNKLTCIDGKLSLFLSNERRARSIGSFRKGSKVDFFYEKFEYHKDVFRANDSWGINYNVLEKLPDNSGIIVKTRERTYKISKKKALEAGSFLWFKEQGLERRFFIPRKDWEIM